ncbi:MAG: hypothetical protein FVQ81_14860 [Candidatus Glassbacteria bacterium]|nr:hypothetical protein [Candidatus Glassbacteria bacterium]
MNLGYHELPLDVRGVFGFLAEEWRTRKFRIAHEISSGKSGAYVYIVEIECDKLKGAGLLKIVPPGAGNESGEIGAVKNATLYNSDFAKRCFPSLVGHDTIDDILFLLYEIAAGSLRFCEPFKDVSQAGQLDDVSLLIDRLLFDVWPKSPPFGDAPLLRDRNSTDLFRDWLDYRANPQESRVPEVLIGRGIAPDAPSFLLEGIWMPNPWHFARRENVGFNLGAHYGPCHGDFHGGNILLERRGNSFITDEVIIIDLDNFSEEKPIFFDHFYLIFERLLRDAGQRSDKDWCDLIRYLLDGKNEPPVDVLSQANFLKNWISRIVDRCKKCVGRAEQLEWQLYHSAVAVGLMFAHRNIDGRRKDLAFLFASCVLKYLLHISNKEDGWPKINPKSWEGRAFDEEGVVDHGALRAFWATCESFDDLSAAYIMVTGTCDEAAAKAIARLPISLVLDVADTEGPHSYLKAFKDAVKFGHGWHTLTSDNLVSIGFRNRGQGLIRLKPNFEELSAQYWRRNLKRAVTTQLEHLVTANRHKQIVVLLSPSMEHRDVYRNVVETLDEVLGETITKVVALDQANPDWGDLLKDLEKSGIATSKVEGGLSTLKLATILMRGEHDFRGESIWIPMAKERGGQDDSLLEISADDAAKLVEDFDVIHDGVGSERFIEGDFDKFVQGHEISWHGVRKGQAMDRDELAKLLVKIRENIGAERCRVLHVWHMPGAGGTTLGRVAAWTFRNKYPTISVKRWSPHLSSRIHLLSNLSNMPILVLLDGRIVSSNEVRELQQELSSQHVKALLLHVRRKSSGSEDKSTDLFLDDQMSNNETERLFDIYSQFCDLDTRNALRTLIDSKNHRYRTPFVFGVTVFGGGYNPIKGRIEEAVSGENAQAKKLLIILSIVAKFSEVRCPISIANTLLGLVPDDRGKLRDKAGVVEFSLLDQDTDDVWILHPVIANEILEKAFGIEDINSDHRWLGFLPDYVLSLIDAASVAQVAPDEFNDFLQELFIQRDLDSNNQFSQLIELMDVENGRKTLERLTEKYPRQAHFFHHLARFKNRKLRLAARECLADIEKAVELDPRNPLHRHGLGMIYRSEVYDICEHLRQKDPNAHSEIIADYNELIRIHKTAEDAFKEARRLEIGNEYSFVSDIQMKTRIVEAFVAVTGGQDFAKFLQSDEPYVQWCSNLLSTAQDLKMQLDRMQVGSYSDMRNKCGMKLREIAGDSANIIAGYERLLNAGDASNMSWIRRGLAHTLIAKSTRIAEDDALRIYNLFEENISDDPSANVSDIRLWFAAYRELRRFSLDEAMQRIEQWAMITDDVEAYFYRYILKFVSFFRQRITDVSVVREAIEESRSRNPANSRTYVYEWWVGQPDHLPVMSTRVLGESRPGPNFKRAATSDAMLEGRVAIIDRPQLGYIDYQGLRITCTPGMNLLAGRDEGKPVKFKLGFRYDGPYAWDPELI